MAPAASDATSSFKSMLWFLKKHEFESQVIAAWVGWVILRHLQSILGPMRRHSSRWLVQYGAMAAYYLPTLVVFYTANAIYSSNSDLKVILSLGCLFLLISSARGAVTMTAFTLGDGPRALQSWRLLPWLLYFAWLLWGLIWRDRRLTLSDLYCFLVLSVAPVLYVLLFKPRVANLEYETKELADHMMREREWSPSPFFNDDADSSLYDRCRYPFKLGDGRWINFSDVLQQRQRGRLTGDPDVCLSYSFCRLLARRYFKFPCAEDGSAQVREFVLRELLPDDDSNRAFTIVEVQLALLHDYFFTNYHSKITSGLLSVKQGIVLVVGFSLFYFVWFAANFVAG